MRVLADKKLQHTAFGKTEEVQLWVQEYPNGRTGLQLMCKIEDMDDLASPGEEHLEPYMTASVNLPMEPCPPTEVWIKDWSENEGITEYLVKWGVIEPERTAMAVSGYVVIDRHRFTPAMLLEIARVKEAGMKKQRGSTRIHDVLQIMSLSVLIVFAGYGLDYLERITKRIELSTCTTDSECVNACRALLKKDEKDDCEDFMEERE